MSWVRVWIHLVFTTKNREQVLTFELRKELFSHILQNANEKGILLDCVNGYSDHVHCLIALNKDQTVSSMVQLIKGESSHWINTNKLLPGKFHWQDDYWAVGVSESHIEALRKYIYEQEEHHRVRSFTEEIDDFMKKYGWQFVK